jgi:hypothetical protein
MGAVDDPAGRCRRRKDAMKRAMKPTTARLALGVALVLTLVAAWFAPAGEAAPEIAQPQASRARAPHSAARPKAPVVTDVLAIRSRAGDNDDAAQPNLFNASAWGAAKTAPTAPAAPPPEAAPTVAPPLPFKVLGSHVQDGRTVVFLQQNEINHVVRVGDTLAGTYQVERLEGATLTLRYLPLNQVQTLDLGRTLLDK